MNVTARELKLRLGRYLEAVQRGETLRVTLRGKAIAEIRPLGQTSHERLARLVAEGRLSPGKGRLDAYEPQPGARSATAIVLADREAEEEQDVLDQALGVVPNQRGTVQRSAQRPATRKPSRPVHRA
jgi:antitoxin (DNA-binding transcriptional repressor) of toxin-antitoxin stability system